MFFRQIFDEKLAQYAYLIGCQRTREAVIVDPERDIDRYLEAAAREGLNVVAAAETHIHADYLSGLRECAERGIKVYASGEGGPDWRYEWLAGSAYPHQLLRDGDTFRVGNVELKALHTPGHTPEHLVYLVTDYGGGADVPMGMASGDFVFVGDLGRPDLLESAAGMAGMMEPSARMLYRSVLHFLDLPDYLQLWPGHGAGSACGKALGAVPESTVGYERRFNSGLLSAQRGEEAFVADILSGQPEPPLYFARMKRDNRRGPKVLGRLPVPERIRTRDLAHLAGRTDVAVIDTRLDRMAFMQGHLPGSLYAPLNKTFNTIAGSYVEEDMPIYLIVEEERLEEAVRDLVRVGLDHIAGYIRPRSLKKYAEAGGTLATIETIDFRAFAGRWQEDTVAVLDVRGQAEYDAAHIPDALQIAHTRLLARREVLPTDRQLLMHCGTGVRAAPAAALLARLGYPVVYVNDTFASWAARGEVVREPALVAS